MIIAIPITHNQIRRDLSCSFASITLDIFHAYNYVNSVEEEYFGVSIYLQYLPIGLRLFGDQFFTSMNDIKKAIVQEHHKLKFKGFKDITILIINIQVLYPQNLNCNCMN